MAIPQELMNRMLGDPGPGGVPQLRRDVAAWAREHPEDRDALREAMEGVEQVELLKPAGG